MSDEDDALNLSEESDGDFDSASSDDWKPDEKNDSKAEESSDYEESAVTEAETDSSPVKISRKEAASNRGKPQKKCMNLPKTSMSNATVSILKKYEMQKRRSIAARSPVPDFDCNAGMDLLDSGSSDSDNATTPKPTTADDEKRKTSSLIDSINKSSGKTIDLRFIHDNLKQMEADKQKLLNYKPSSENEDNLNINDIAQLLALGEAGSSTTKVKKKKIRSSQQADDSDSDNWDEVEDEPKAYEIPKEGLTIMLDIQNQERSKNQSKEIDYEACMKRKLNRIIKEHQVVLHKVNLVCWVSHGNYVNPIINNRRLMAECLKLLPENKQHCYPKEKTDIDYFKQITHWFKSTVILKKNFQNMYCKMRNRPPLMSSLALQIRAKSAICRRDYVLIFICLLRAIGIQCRMVQSIITAPIRPAQSDLLVISSKSTEGKSKPKPRSKSNSNKSKSNTVKKSKSSGSSENSSFEDVSSNKKSPTKPAPRSSRTRNKPAVNEKIPQMDGADDKPGTKKSNEKKPPATKKNSEVVLKNSLKVAPSPRRLRSRSKSGETTENIVKPIVESSLEDGADDKPGKKKSNEKTPPAAKKNSEVVLKNSLKVAPSPRRLRSRSKSGETTENVVKPIVKLSIDSAKPSTSKSPKPPATKALETLKPATSKSRSKSAQSAETSKDVENLLDIFSPRRTRRSHIVEVERPSTSKDVAKPNLKSLLNVANNRKRTTEQKVEEVTTKKPKVVIALSAASSSRSSKKRHSPNANESDLKSPKSTKRDIPDENSSDSLKFFKPKETDLKVKTPNKVDKTPTPKLKDAPAIRRTKARDNRVLSTDDDEVIGKDQPESKGIDIWVEVYSEHDDRWITIDVYREKVDCIKEIYQKASHPMIYVLAWNNDSSVKDVSARYIPNLNTTVRKMRVEADYFEKTLKPFIGVKTPRDRQEDNDLNILQLAVPMPTTVSGFKNHPLYALKRHLLKYQALYPADAPTLGFLRDEGIYPRDCVFTLHSRELWVKQARTVKLHEEPYKIVKAHPKWDRATKKTITDIPLELFGIWQTQEYEPPVAENGIVPRNAYGNVELFKACMLPVNTIHLQLPGLNKVCRKLGIDCAQAVVGFDYHGGYSHAVFDGFVVCEEFLDKVTDAWNREQEEIDRKETEKYENRVYGNWKKLIKGLRIQQYVKRKYNNNGDPQE